MQRIPEDKILKYNPDTMVSIRKMYNLDKPGQMDEAIDLLDDWVKKQSHFEKRDFSREYLERVIILLKGSIERAKAQMDKLCTLRMLLPHFFDKVDARNDLKDKHGFESSAFLPRLTKDHYRIIISKFEPAHYTSKIYFQIFVNYVLLCEYLKAHDYSNGIITILDFRNIDIIDFVAQINLTEMRQIATIILEGYDTRAKSFYFISTSKTIDIFIKIFKQMISEKLRKRIYVIKELEELQEHISRELLPCDYGGDEKPMATLSSEFMEVLSSKENIKYLKEIMKARTNKSMLTSSKYDEEFLGIAGTFRTLNVD